MKAYLVYNRKSGKIVHVHRETGQGEREKSDILRLVHPSHDRSDLEVRDIRATNVQPGEVFRVDPKTKKVEPAKSGVGSAAGAHRH